MLYKVIEFDTMDNENGNNIKDIIDAGEILVSIDKQTNCLEMNFNYMNNTIKDYYKDLIAKKKEIKTCIITNEDYINLQELLYNLEDSLLSYNDLFYILKMSTVMEFETEPSNIYAIEKAYSNLLKTS